MTTNRISAAEFRAGPKKKDRLGSVAKRTEYAGVMYASKGEARFAERLDGWKASGLIVAWRRQVKMPLLAGNGAHVCNYVIDFVLELPAGGELWIEVKGWDDPRGQQVLKRKHFIAQHPERWFMVVDSRTLLPRNGASWPWEARTVDELMERVVRIMFAPPVVAARRSARRAK